MIDKERIKAEAEKFFEWPSKEKTYVTTVSMLIFANVIAEMARDEEREACAKACEDAWKETLCGADRASWNAAVNSCAAGIRERSNAIYPADSAG